jgi:hypothetical protein
MLQHWRLSPPELFAFPIQDAHHGTRPAILHSLRSVTHEPDEEPNRLQGGGSHRRVCTCSGWHIHVDDVPGHHRHFAARHFIRLMLHCTPRCRIAGAGGHRATLYARPCSREGACLVVFAYSATDAYGKRPSIVSSWRGLCPLLHDDVGKSGTPHLPATADAALPCGQMLKFKQTYKKVYVLFGYIKNYMYLCIVISKQHV